MATRCLCCSIDQVIKGVASRTQRPPEEAREVVRNVFISLVQSHYIERAPPCTLPVPMLAPHPASVKKRSAKSGRVWGLTRCNLHSCRLVFMVWVGWCLHARSEMTFRVWGCLLHAAAVGEPLAAAAAQGAHVPVVTLNVDI